MSATFRKRPLEITAVRYGKEDTGEWYPGAVQYVAAFILGREGADIGQAIAVDVVRPVGNWNPPEHGEVQIWDATVHKAWLPLNVGDWVAKGVLGEFYPISNDVMEASYDRIS